MAEGGGKRVRRVTWAAAGWKIALQVRCGCRSGNVPCPPSTGDAGCQHYAPLSQIDFNYQQQAKSSESEGEGPVRAG